MSTLTEAPRAFNPLPPHQPYQTRGVRRPVPPLAHHHPHPPGSPLSTTTTSSTTISSTTSTATGVRRGQAEHGMQLRSSRKRQKVPDWDDFYKNGVPDEVIVIDDDDDDDDNDNNNDGSSPGPTASKTTRKRALNDQQHGETNGVSTAASASKKRRLDASASRTANSSLKPANGSSNKGSPTTSLHHADQNSLPTSSLAQHARINNANANANGNSRAGQKRKRTAQDTPNGLDPRALRNGDAAEPAFEEYQGPSHRISKAKDVNVRVIPDDTQKEKKVRLDDDDGHYIVIPDTELAGQYTIRRLLGQGTFGKVVQAIDRKSNKAVAVKVIRSVAKYRDAARIELRALQTLRQNDPENRYRCIHLQDCFDFRGHICIVTDLLDLSLFDFLKANSFVPFPNSHIQSFARQLFTSVAFLHDLNLVHTDLKPENILLCDAASHAFTYNRRIPSSQFTSPRRAGERKVLASPDIRLIDFGSATFDDEYHSTVVSTRHYRAPEIILGLGWSFPCDIWSIGCILIEFYTGDALFQTHDNLEHLAMIEAVCGSRVPFHLVRKLNKSTSKSSSSSPAKYFKRLKLDYPGPETTRASRRFVKNMKRLDETIPHNTSTFMKNFLDLLQRIFVCDPDERITAKEALQHPWFNEIPQDDGTAAANMRFRHTASESSSRAASSVVQGTQYRPHYG